MCHYLPDIIYSDCGHYKQKGYRHTLCMAAAQARAQGRKEPTACHVPQQVEYVGGKCPACAARE